MNQKQLIMYIIDNDLYLYKDKLIKEKAKPNVFRYGKISKPKEFIKFFESIIKKYKLNKSLLNNSITVIIDPTYTQADTDILNDILDKLSFNKISFINIINLLVITRKRIYFIIAKHYMYLIHLNYKNNVETIFIDYKLFKNNINILLNHLIIFFKKKQVIVLGITGEIDSIAEKIEELSKTPTFYIQEPINYLIEKAKNTL